MYDLYTSQQLVITAACSLYTICLYLQIHGVNFLYSINFNQHMAKILHFIYVFTSYFLFMITYTFSGQIYECI